MFITNMTVGTPHISLPGDLAVTWTWWWTAALVGWPLACILCYFFPRAVTHFATVPFYLLISTRPSLTGTAEEEQN